MMGCHCFNSLEYNRWCIYWRNAVTSKHVTVPNDPVINQPYCKRTQRSENQPIGWLGLFTWKSFQYCEVNDPNSFNETVSCSDSDN